MNPLTINPTDTSPFVNLNPAKGEYVVGGCSRPENAKEVYHPIMVWLNAFSQEQLALKEANAPLAPVNFHFRFTYYNSASVKFLFKIIVLLNEMQKAELPVTIIWNFDKGDEEFLEAGRTLSDMVKVPFSFVELPGKS